MKILQWNDVHFVILNTSIFAVFHDLAEHATVVQLLCIPGRNNYWFFQKQVEDKILCFQASFFILLFCLSNILCCLFILLAGLWYVGPCTLLLNLLSLYLFVSSASKVDYWLNSIAISNLFFDNCGCFLQSSAIRHCCFIYMQMTVYSCGVSVLMPGDHIPTYIAHPAPIPCPPERIPWPQHQHNDISNDTTSSRFIENSSSLWNQRNQRWKRGLFCNKSTSYDWFKQN